MKSNRCALAVFTCLLFAANAALGQQQLPLFPKYQVLGVIYAPPGNTSSVSYMNSTQIGSSHSIVSDSSTTTTQTQSSTSGFNLFGLGYSSTQTTSDSWISAYENTKSQSLQTTTSNGIAVSGPFSGLGVLHDADLVVLWLNPVLKTTLLPLTNGGTVLPIQWSGWMFNSCDLNATQNPYNFMQLIDGCDPNGFPFPDIIKIPVSCLKNPYFNPASNGCAQYLGNTLRTWDLDPWGVDSVSKVPVGPGLTLQDYADILQADPFVTQTLVANNTQAGENVYTNPCHMTYGINFDPNTQETIPNSATFTPPFMGQWPPNYCGTPGTIMDRFIPIAGQLPYPAPINGVSQTSTGGLSNTAVSTSGTSWTDTHTHSFNEMESLTFAAEASYGAISGVTLSNLSAGFNFGTTSGSGSSWTDGQTIGKTATSSLTNAANYSVTGPKGSDNWTGPSEYNVFQDTIYGTFAFRDSDRSTSTQLITAGKLSPIGVAFTGNSNFGTVTVGQKSAAITVTLTNNSPNQMNMQNPALSFSDLASNPDTTNITTPWVSSFAIVAGSDTCSTKVVLTGKTCTVKIQFAPNLNAAPNTIKANYPIAAYLIASGNELVPVADSNGIRYNEQVLVTNTVIRVTGTTETAVKVAGTAAPAPATCTGIKPSCNIGATLTPATTTFPANAKTGSQVYTFKNYASTSQTISSIQLTDTADFSITSDTCSGATLGSLHTCTFTLLYSAKGIGNLDTKVSVVNTTNGVTTTLAFAGAAATVNVARISVTSGFSSLTCYITQNSQSGSCGASTTGTLTNTGTYTVVLTGATGTNNFFGSAAGTLAPGASTGVSVGANETCNNGPFGNCSFSGTVTFTGTAQTGGSGTPVSASASDSITTIFCPPPCIPPTVPTISNLGLSKRKATPVNPAWAGADLSNSPGTVTAKGNAKQITK